nr:reverse transcriptase domain-containing protein [Tanacetum cinerariifolium]
MPPKRRSTSVASTSATPTMTQAAIRQLFADSIIAALETQAANMANTENTNGNTGPREIMTLHYQVSDLQHEKGHYNYQCSKANNNAHGKAYFLRDKNAHQDPNVVTDTTHDFEMANENLVGTNTVIQGCTLILLNQPFKVDLMPIKLGSFDVVIGIDWISKYHAKIICDEKVVHIPINGETLIIRGRACKSPEDNFGITQKEGIDFSKIAKSFTELTQKNKKYILDEDQEIAFQLLKQKLYEALILALPEGNDDFVVYSDASHQILGVVLMQKEKANVVADALSQKERIKPLRVRSLVMTIHLKFPSKILKAQTEAIKEKNIKAENLRGMDKAFEIRHDGTRCIKNRSWLPLFGGDKTNLVVKGVDGGAWEAASDMVVRSW